MKVYLDCSNGITGVKLIGALLDIDHEAKRDLHATLGRLQQLLRCGIDYSVGIVKRNGFKATRVAIACHHGKIGPVPALAYLSTVRNCASFLSLPAQRLADRVASMLVEAEARVHGEPVESLSLHDVASPCSFAQLICAAQLLERLNMLNAEFLTGPVAVGGGRVAVRSHGLLPVPTPATKLILESGCIPTVRGPVDAELTTPLGAALLASLEPKFVKQIPRGARRIGCGAGEEIAGTANLLVVYALS